MNMYFLQGFLPESMFERILTGPVVREEVSRRGRRPKSGVAKAPAVAATPASRATGNPLLANGLLPGVDLSALQALQQNLQNLQSLQVTAGLMGMPAGLSSGGETKNMAAMFPMLFSGMAGLPNLLGMGGLLSKTAESGAEEKRGNDCKELEGKKERTESQSSENGERCVPGSPSTSSTAALSSAAAAKPIALNPLLLSNILYPGMLLTPGPTSKILIASPGQEAKTQGLKLPGDLQVQFRLRSLPTSWAESPTHCLG